MAKATDETPTHEVVTRRCRACGEELAEGSTVVDQMQHRCVQGRGQGGWVFEVVRSRTEPCTFHERACVKCYRHREPMPDEIESVARARQEWVNREAERLAAEQTYPVRGSRGDLYYVRITEKGASCTCPAWRFQKKPTIERTCKHIRQVLEGAR